MAILYRYDLNDFSVQSNIPLKSYRCMLSTGPKEHLYIRTSYIQRQQILLMTFLVLLMSAAALN